MRAPSACSSISSQTQPQNVHVALLTTVRLISDQLRLRCALCSTSLLGAARTGRYHEGSTKLPAAEDSAESARHISAGVDHFPRRDICGGSRRGDPLVSLFGVLAFLVNA